MERPNKILGGIGKPFHHHGYESLLCCTKITVVNEAKMPFWDAPWLDGQKLKDIPLSFS
jgi:hypothetical protein